MSRPPGTAPGQLQQIGPDRPIRGDLVGHRAYRGDFKAAVGLNTQLAAQVVAGLLWVKLPVQAVGGVLPKVQACLRQGLALRVAHPTAQQHRLPGVGANQVGWVGQPRRAHRVKRPQHTARRCPRLAGQQINQAGQPNHIRQQRKLTAAVVRDVADPVQKGQQSAPLGMAELDLPRKIVHLLEQGLHQQPLPLIRQALKTLSGGLGDFFQGDVFHARTGLDSRPTWSISTSIRSPAFSQTGGVRA